MYFPQFLVVKTIQSDLNARSVSGTLISSSIERMFLSVEVDSVYLNINFKFLNFFYRQMIHA